MPAQRIRVRAGLAPLVALALCLGPVLGGCRATQSLEPPLAPALVVADPLPITLSQSLRLWKASTSSFGNKTNFRLGALLERLFPATDGQAFLSPVHAELATDWNAAASAWESSYTFALSLQRDGKHHPILAEGHGRSSDDPRGADRAALEDCVTKIYAEVSAVLAGQGG